MTTVFSPRLAGAFTERWSYRTAILRTEDDTEQRQQLRRIPTRQWHYPVLTLASRRTGWLDALLYGGQTEAWLVPYWPHRSALTAAASAGSNVVLSVDTTDRDFVVGGSAILWRGEESTEAVTVSAKTASSLTVDTLAADWPVGTIVLPAQSARWGAGAPKVTRTSRRNAALEVTFDLDAVTDPAVTTPAGPAAFNAATINRREPATDTYTPSVDRFQTPTGEHGGFQDFARGGSPIRDGSRLLWSGSRADVASLLAWYHGLKGALTPFWLPTYQADLTPTADLASDTLTIDAIGYTTRLFPLERNRHLALTPAAGIPVHRHVTASADNGDGTESLTLDASGTLNATTGMVSLMTYVRLTDDPLELTWRTGTLAETTLAVTELPHQVPVTV